MRRTWTAVVCWMAGAVGAVACGDDGESSGVGAGAGGVASGGSASAGATNGGSQAGAGANGGGTSAGNGSGGSGPSCPTSEASACDWKEFTGLACGDESCCGDERACAGERCFALCGRTLPEITEPYAEDVDVLAQVCGFGSALVLRPDDGCEQPVLYTANTIYDAATEQMTFDITRSAPSPRVPAPALELVQQATWSPTIAGPAYGLSTLRVNPGETKAVLSVLHGDQLDMVIDNESSLIEIDLSNGDVRSIEGLQVGHSVWLDDDRLLVYAFTLGSTTPGDSGLYLVDTSGAELEYTFVAGDFQSGAPLGLINGEYVLTGGVPIAGGTPPAFAVVPLAAIEEVASAAREPIDVFADSAVQRIEREPWELQGYILGGRWLLSPADTAFSAYRVEPLTMSDGVLSVGAQTTLISDATTFAGAHHLGDNRLLVFTGAAGQIITAP